MKHLRLLITSFIVMTLLIAMRPGKDSSIICWESDAQLSWSDFQGKVPRGSGFDALSHCGLEMDMHMEQFDELIFEVRATFESDKSWVKEGASKPYLLEHEQLHFHIYERYARELRKRLQAEKYSDIQAVSDRINEIYQEVHQEIRAAQRAYDEETEHSHLRAQQAEWTEKINRELDELSEYSASSFIVGLSPE